MCKCKQFCCTKRIVHAVCLSHLDLTKNLYFQSLGDGKYMNPITNIPPSSNLIVVTTPMATQHNHNRNSTLQLGDQYFFFLFFLFFLFQGCLSSHGFIHICKLVHALLKGPNGQDLHFLTLARVRACNEVQVTHNEGRGAMQPQNCQGKKYII